MSSEEGCSEKDHPELAVKVTGLSKTFHIYEKPVDRLKQFLWRGRRHFARDFPALKNVNLEIAKGQTFGIIGRNGAGKSTLLQLICGTLAPTAGELSVNGRVAALLELGSGFNPEFTGKENVRLNAQILGLSDEEIDAKYQDIVDFADIGEFIEQPIRTYSSGMVLRLAFAVIAHVDADVLVIDEALAVGDAFFTQKCMRFLREFKIKGTILFVSHDTASLINLCDGALWLEHGEVVMQGSAKEVSESYLEAIYESQQGRSIDIDDDGTIKSAVVNESVDYVDMRQDLLNTSTLRNDIELFQFNRASSSFGKRGVTIEKVMLVNSQRQPLSWVVGGEMVALKVSVHGNTLIKQLIVGFLFKDRLGQELFGDNNYLSCRDQPVRLLPGQQASVEFSFRMPIVPAGDYSITVALADGIQTDHVQHDWIHEALLIKSHSSSVTTGLLGVPMHSINIVVEKTPANAMMTNEHH